MALLGALTLPTPAWADWTGPRDIVHGTANTVEQGELLIGIVTPAIYGIRDSVTLLVHPLNWLLLAPNVGLRVRVVDTDLLRFSIQGELGATIVDDEANSEVSDPRPFGRAALSGIVTFDVGSGVMLTAGTGYQADFDPSEHNITFWGGVNWLIGRSNVILTEGGAQYGVVAGRVAKPQGTVMWAYAWDVARLGVGVAFGEFPIVRVTGQAANINFWPLIDYWGRF